MRFSTQSRGRGGRIRSGLGLGTLILATAAGAATADDGASIGQPNRVTLVRRSVRQDQGAWVVDYQIRNETPTGLIVTPAEIEVRSEGWVSNSRVAGHAVPRRAAVAIKAAEKATADADVIPAADDPGRCRERLSLAVWSDDQAPDAAARPAEAVAPISLAPGATGLVRLRYAHQHVVHGDYDPLLGERTVAVRFGQETFHDVVPLDREARVAYPKAGWPEAPDDRRDPRHFVSGPDSLHLEAHVPGRQYYRFPDRPVRYGSRMRLTFWYLIAYGTVGESRVRLAQYKDTPTSCRVLPGGGFDQELTVVGRWTKVEKLVRIEAEATTAALDFRISSDANLGEMWIDDVALDPLDAEALAQGP
ncbi:hypothetical protein [Paludisphaera mucosa]|uniref:Uncharacterized protein n=1 Tax=Paludisphaera mucosa TaxID=3030827 RepID=A0ABT6FJB6_9BACT|nr:hypothetical protein [Paludisphaera mucosa]MDG3007644.1 hypothetical protein [Paludisphaera mucosa]